MRARLTGAAAVLALVLTAALAPSAPAQSPLPTPTPSASPTPSATPSPSPTPTPTPTPREQRDAKDRKAKEVRKIYRDFERDGRIDDCSHTLKALKRARRSISDSYAEQYPDFKDALDAAIQRHNNGTCKPAPTDTGGSGSGSGSGSGGTGTGTGGGTGSSGGAFGGGTTTTPPAPSAPSPGALPSPSTAAPALPPASGRLPSLPKGGSSGGRIAPRLGEGSIREGTPTGPPPTATPAPGAAPAPTPLPLAVTRPPGTTDLFVPGTLLAVALLGLLAAGASVLLSRRSERFAGVAHAWREAAWRTSGTWADFRDWLHAGR